MFFILVYIHIARGLYYGSYRAPRATLWIVGVIIYICMMATAFIGYVQIWGYTAQNDFSYLELIIPTFGGKKVKTNKRIGPHNIDVLSVLIGNLLGDGQGELRSNSPRFSIHMSSKNREYLNWLHKFYSTRGYCSENTPKFSKQIGKFNKIFFCGKFSTYTFSSLNWLYSIFYCNKIKKIPNHLILKDLLTPLSLAIWYMDDGCLYNKNGGILHTNCLNLEQLKIALYNLYNINIKITEKKDKNKIDNIFIIPSGEMPKFIKLIKPYMITSKYHKLPLHFRSK